MTIEEFAAAWKYRGISVDFDQADLEFANAWATVVLGNYLMDEGTNKFNLGKSILQEEEKTHSPERDEASGGLIIQ